MNFGQLSAIILSAGFSSRMRRFKPLLPVGKATVIERVVGLYRSAGIDDICVVAGHRADDLLAVLQAHPVRCIVNRTYEKGMYTSLVAGVSALPEGCRGFFVHPVDMPRVRPSTLVALAAAFGACSDHSIHPTFDSRRGHPPLVSTILVPAILAWSGDGGLRAFWADRAAPMKDVPVADAGILRDLDTPEDYRRLWEDLDNEDLPTADECRVLMTQVAGVPDTVWRHCRAVCRVAEALADALQQAGTALDTDLIRAAALLHDIARQQPDHAVAGARLLQILGFQRVAAAVRVHMDIETTPDLPLDEAQLVFLADKCIVGARMTNLEERFERKMAKYGTDPHARAAINRRFEAARWIQAKVARLTGRALAALLPDFDIERDFSHDVAGES
jgi:putative nucleotidyltransferase with HDIG domain